MKKDKKILLIATGGIFIVSLIIILLVIILNKKTSKNNYIEEENINVESLEMQFNDLFNNKENEFISQQYEIIEEKTGEYNIEAYIPFIHISNEINNKINKEINDIFSKKILQIVNQNENYTVLKMNYATSFNNNIVSLAIRCILKEGNNAQRTIIKTYNYDVQNGKIINAIDIIPEQKREEVQKLIHTKIQVSIKKEQTIINQGYNVYRRNPDNSMYLLNNATEFYIDNNIIYIIYSYGNNNYTSEMDLIISKI